MYKSISSYRYHRYYCKFYASSVVPFYREYYGDFTMPYWINERSG
jgi:hypothetical protein